MMGPASLKELILIDEDPNGTSFQIFWISSLVKSTISDVNVWSIWNCHFCHSRAVTYQQFHMVESMQTRCNRYSEERVITSCCWRKHLHYYSVALKLQRASKSPVMLVKTLLAVGLGWGLRIPVSNFVLQMLLLLVLESLRPQLSYVIPGRKCFYYVVLITQ